MKDFPQLTFTFTDLLKPILCNRYSLVADHPQWNVLKGDMMGLTTKQKEYDADIDDLLKCLGSHFVVNVNDGPIL